MKLSKEQILGCLSSMGACHKAKKWVQEAAENTVEELWEACPNRDWKRWLLGKLLRYEVIDIEIGSYETYVNDFTPDDEDLFEAACIMYKFVTESNWSDYLY